MNNAFNGDRGLKARLLWGLREHKRADALIRGAYGAYDVGSVLPDGFRGCAVGCAAHVLNIDVYQHDLHTLTAEAMGITTELMQIQDAIFESLPLQDAFNFPLQFMRAIPVGADLSDVWPKFAQALLVSTNHYRSTPKYVNRILVLFRTPDLQARQAGAMELLSGPDSYLAVGVLNHALAYCAGTSWNRAHAMVYLHCNSYPERALLMRDTLLKLLKGA